MDNTTAHNIKLSVIIPTYNSAETVKSSLDSIKIQLFKDYEVIIVDGLSTDETVSVVKDYTTSIENLKWISEKDKGVYDAMNKGIMLASGEWLYFLGSNDYLINEYVFKNIFTVIQDKQPDFLYGNVIWGHSNMVYAGKAYTKDVYFQNVCHQAIFARKKLLIRHGNFNLNYGTFADWDMNIKIFRDKLAKIEYVDQVIAYYDLTGISSKQTDESEKERAPLIKNYFSLRNRGLLYLSKKVKTFGEYLIPKQ